MPELGPYGPVRGALSNERPYRDLGAPFAWVFRVFHTAITWAHAQADRSRAVFSYGGRALMRHECCSRTDGSESTLCPVAAQESVRPDLQRALARQTYSVTLPAPALNAR